MTRYLARRLLVVLPMLVGVATLVFALLRLIPGDPVQAMLGEAASPADVAAVRGRLGLDRPIHLQYAAFLGRALTGDLGTSLRTNQPVTAAIAERLPATLELAAAAMAMALVAGLALGIVAAVRARSRVDHLATGVALVGLSIPNFWLGPLLAIVFAVVLGWLPVSGRGTPAHLVLPAITLGAPLAAVLARLTRASVIEELREPYVLAARARGASARRVVLRHALPNGLIPIVTVAGLQFGAVLTGAVITETIFAWPGVGRLLVQSISLRDYPLVQGCILFIATIYVIYGALDPRIRYR
jgi:ABC-type dipeptide/oligopeptide/nickel transport system permease component